MWGPPLPVHWKGALVGHFERLPEDNDFPRVNGRWTACDSPLAKQFERFLLETRYLDRAQDSRVKVGTDPGRECAVYSLRYREQVTQTGKKLPWYWMVLSTGVPPDLGEG